MPYRISDLPALSGALADTDLLEIVDVSDTGIAPTGTSKSITVAQLRAAVAFRLKDAARCVVTAPVTLATAIVVGGSVDGVTLAAGNRVLVAGQVDTAANGVYVVQSSGAPQRAADFAAGARVAAALIPIEAGSRADSLWICTADAGSDTVGTHPLGFATVTGPTPPFDDTTAIVRDDSRPTTQLRFDLGLLTTAQTRVVTMADRNLNLATPVFDSVTADDIDAGVVATDTLAAGAASATTLSAGGSGVAWVFAADGVAAARGLVPATRSPAIASGVAALDWRASSDWDVLLDTSATITFTQARSGQVIYIRVARSAAGATQPTWSQTINWAGGTAPVLAETAGAWLYVWVRCLGSTYEGSLATSSGGGGGGGGAGGLRYQLLDYGVGASQFDLDARFADYFALGLSTSTNTQANTITIANAQVGQRFLLRFAATSGVSPTTAISRVTWTQTVNWLTDPAPLPNNATTGAGPVVWVMLVCTAANTFDGWFEAAAAGGSGGTGSPDNTTSIRPLINLTTGLPTNAPGTLGDVANMLNAGGSQILVTSADNGSHTLLDARFFSTAFITFTGLGGAASLAFQNPRVGQRLRIRFATLPPAQGQTLTGVTWTLRAPGNDPNAIVVRRVGHAHTQLSPNPSPRVLVSPHNVPLPDSLASTAPESPTWVDLMYCGLSPLGMQTWDVFPSADRALSGQDIRHGSSVPVAATATVADALNYLRANGGGGGSGVTALAGLGLQFESVIRTRPFAMVPGILHRAYARNMTVNGATAPGALRHYSLDAFLPATAAIGDRTGVLIVDDSLGSGALLDPNPYHANAWSLRVSFHDSEIVGAVNGVGGTVATPSRMVFYKDPVLLGPGRCRVNGNPDALPGFLSPLLQDYYVQNTPETCGLKVPGEFLVFRYDTVSRETEHPYGAANAGVGSTQTGWVLEHWYREPPRGRVGPPRNSYNGDTSVPAYSDAANAATAIRGWVRFGDGSYPNALSTYEDYPGRTVPTTTNPIACALIPWAVAGKTIRVRYCVEYSYQTGSPVTLEFTPMWTTPRGYGVSFASTLPAYLQTATPTGLNDGLGRRVQRTQVTDYGNVQHVRYEEEWVIPVPAASIVDDIPGLQPGQTESRKAVDGAHIYYKTISLANNPAGTNRSPDNFWRTDVSPVPFLGLGVRYRPIPILGSVNSFMFIGLGRVSSGLMGPLEPSPFTVFTPQTYLEYAEESATGQAVTATSEVIQQELPALTGTGVVVYAETGEAWSTRIVTGVTNQTVVTNGNGALADPITIGLASTYVGQVSITTLGTIATGVWQGTPIGIAYGGTGTNTAPTAGQMLLGTGGGAYVPGSIQGVADRIVVDVNANQPRVNIAATYVGQTSITTLGTIATGVWQGTPLTVAYGGTGSTVAPTVGQLAYCASAGVYAPGAITVDGTPGLGVTTGAGGYTLALSQPLSAASHPTFSRVTLSNAPTADSHAATKAYVDSVAAGLDVKASCRVATTADLVSLSGALTIDTVVVAAGDRVLVKNQTTTTQNGIWVAASGAWSRAADADTGAKLTSGAYCYISEGATNAGTSWVMTAPDPITIGSSAITWGQFGGGGGGAGGIVAGAGLVLTGNVIDTNVDGATLAIVSDTLRIAAGYTGQASITTLGTVTAGVWQATPLGVTYGGTGLSAAPAAGQVAVGTSAGGYQLTTIAGTTNRVTVTSASGAITVSGPQDIHTGASPTFAALTLSSAPTAANHAATKSYVDSAVYRNLLVNSSFRTWQRGTSLTLADGGMGPDGWFVLSENGGVVCAPGTGFYGIGVGKYAIAQVSSTQRVGFGQVLFSNDVYKYAGGTNTFWFQCDVFTSTTKSVRVAVLYGTGTVDNQPRDMVNNWASTNYTAGNFFHANWVPLAVQQGAAGPSGYRFSFPISVTGDQRNIGVLIWTEDQLTAGQNMYIGEPILSDAGVPQIYRPPSYSDELAACLRRYCKTFERSTVAANNAGFTGALSSTCSTAVQPCVSWRFPVQMGKTPTVTLFNPGVGAAGQWKEGGTAALADGRSFYVSTDGVSIDNTEVAAANAKPHFIHATASAEPCS